MQVFKEWLPLVRDSELLKDGKKFFGHEATHSVRHGHVLNHLAAQRPGTADFTRHVYFLFESCSARTSGTQRDEHEPRAASA